MKNYFPLAGMAMICALSCSPPEMARDSELRTTDESGIIPIGGHAHQYPIDSSVRLMSNLMHTAGLDEVSEVFGWGGSFPASAFRVSSVNQGVLLWYCFRGGANPELFLALEHLNEYDPHNLPRRPVSNELTLPSTIFYSNSAVGRNEESIRDYLRTATGDQSQWNTAPAEEINAYVISADSLFGIYRDAQGERYNNYMFGFFSARHEAAFEAFVESAGENGYIRYYFGYDERDRPNRVRIILMAVDSRGINQSMARINDGDGGGSMQRSWPPPPEN